MRSASRLTDTSASGYRPHVTLRELIAAADSLRVPLLVGFAAVVIVTALIGALHGKGRGGRAPWRYLYAVLVYAACVPGTFAAVLVLYSLFFSGEDLLDVNVVIYLVPIAAMVATLGVMRRNVDFDSVPGFNRLTGLMTMLGVAFVVAFVLQRLRVWLFFGAPMIWFFVLVAALFALFKWGGRLLLGRRRS